MAESRQNSATISITDSDTDMGGGMLCPRHMAN